MDSRLSTLRAAEHRLYIAELRIKFYGYDTPQSQKMVASAQSEVDKIKAARAAGRLPARKVK